MRRLLTAIAERAARPRHKTGGQEAEPPPEKAQPAESEREPQRASPEPVAPQARTWNLWELDRLARESRGGGIARSEERAYLLVNLRQFANAAGELPPDFDALVRESFGELLTER